MNVIKNPYLFPQRDWELSNVKVVRLRPGLGKKLFTLVNMVPFRTLTPISS